MSGVEAEDGRDPQRRVHGADSSVLPGGGDLDDAHGRHRPDGAEQRARDIVYRSLAARARSRSELMRILLRRGIDEDIAAAVVQKFRDAGLVDDAAFAENWVHERHHHQGLGREALRYELRCKGVEENIIVAVLSTVDSSTEAERARELVRRKLRTMTVPDNRARMRRLVSMLGRKGYSDSLAFRVVKEELEQSGLDTLEDDAGIP
jgi:regulatory protein